MQCGVCSTGMLCLKSCADHMHWPQENLCAAHAYIRGLSCATSTTKPQVVSCPPLTVERRSLVVLAPSAGAVLGQLGAVMGLQEPTFKQVVVLYRCVCGGGGAGWCWCCTGGGARTSRCVPSLVHDTGRGVFSRMSDFLGCPLP
jgi:hypothetical protein